MRRFTLALCVVASMGVAPSAGATELTGWFKTVTAERTSFYDRHRTHPTSWSEGKTTSLGPKAAAEMDTTAQGLYYGTFERAFEPMISLNYAGVRLVNLLSNLDSFRLLSVEPGRGAKTMKGSSTEGIFKASALRVRREIPFKEYEPWLLGSQEHGARQLGVILLARQDAGVRKDFESQIPARERPLYDALLRWNVNNSTTLRGLQDKTAILKGVGKVKIVNTRVPSFEDSQSFRSRNPLDIFVVESLDKPGQRYAASLIDLEPVPTPAAASVTVANP